MFTTDALDVPALADADGAVRALQLLERSPTHQRQRVRHRTLTARV